jgi:hypothetical protein
VLLLHKSGALLAALHLLCWALVRTSLEYPPEHKVAPAIVPPLSPPSLHHGAELTRAALARRQDSAVMVALSGALGFLPLWFYNTALFADKAQAEHYALAANALMLCVLSPIAVLLQSQLAGFLAVRPSRKLPI